MGTTYTTKRHLKNGQVDTPDTPEAAEKSVYTTSRKLKDSAAASPEKGDCTEVSPASADDKTSLITKRKLKSGADHSPKNEARRRQERILAGYDPYDKWEDPIIASSKKTSERTAEIRMEMKKYRKGDSCCRTGGDFNKR